VRPESPHGWGRMSAHQMICHLADSLRMAVGRKPVKEIGGPFQRSLLKWLVLYFPVPWPTGITTCPEIDQHLEGTRPTDFATDVAEVEALLEHVTSGAGELGRHPHSLFGDMSRAAWLRWGYLHMDHHLRQFGA
jgi:hypothetical protein